jgi:acyl carrier protein
LTTQSDVVRVLDSALGLGGRSADFARDTALLGALPEFDSMAAVAILTAVEEQFGITVHDDEVDGSIFATVGSLCDFIDSKLQH